VENFSFSTTLSCLVFFKKKLAYVLILHIKSEKSKTFLQLQLLAPLPSAAAVFLLTLTIGQILPRQEGGKKQSFCPEV
jgi:hypothetical protein